MSLTSPSSLQLAIEAAARACEKAAADLSLLLQLLSSAEAQMQQLSDYQGETLRRWQQRTAHATHQALMHHHHQFVGKLDDAMRMQERVIQERTQAVEQARQRLMDAERKRNGLERYRDRLMAEQQQRLARREQQASDEWAGQRARPTRALMADGVYS
jgi:flagellar FliJ protein